MANVLEPAGSKFETVAVTPDPVQTSELVRAYLLQNPDVETFHTGWSRPAVWAIKVLKEANESNKPCGIMVSNIEEAKDMLEIGFSVIAVSTDLVLLRNAVDEIGKL